MVDPISDRLYAIRATYLSAPSSVDMDVHPHSGSFPVRDERFFRLGGEPVDIHAGLFSLVSREDDRLYLSESSQLVAEVTAIEDGDDHIIVERAGSPDKALERFLQRVDGTAIYLLVKNVNGVRPVVTPAMEEAGTQH